MPASVLLIAILGLLAPEPRVVQDGGGTSRALEQDPLLPAPYQVESVVQFRSDRWLADKGLSLGPPLVTVDLGAVEGAPVPTRDNLETMTIVGALGVAVGRLGEIDQRCVYLCGEDEGAECHYVAEVLLSPAELAAIGTPLIALPGEHTLDRFAIPASGALTGDSLRAAALAGRVLTELAWTPYAESGPATRVAGWSADATRVDLEARWHSGDTFEAAGHDCTVRRIDALTEASCAGLALILEGATPLLVSYADYNTATAEVIATFEHDEGTYYVVLLGLKAQNTIGLLVRTDSGWKGFFRPRDYAMLC